jgi:hypothetical protein
MKRAPIAEVGDDKEEEEDDFDNDDTASDENTDADTDVDDEDDPYNMPSLDSSFKSPTMTLKSFKNRTKGNLAYEDPGSFKNGVRTVDETETELLYRELELLKKQSNDSETNKRHYFWKKAILTEIAKMQSEVFKFSVAVANYCQLDVSEVLMDIPNHYVNTMEDGKNMLKSTVMTLLKDLPHAKSEADAEYRRTLIRIIFNIANQYRDKVFSSDTQKDIGPYGELMNFNSEPSSDHPDWLSSPQEVVSSQNYSISGKIGDSFQKNTEDENPFLIQGGPNDPDNPSVFHPSNFTEYLNELNHNLKVKIGETNYKHKLQQHAFNDSLQGAKIGVAKDRIGLEQQKRIDKIGVAKDRIDLEQQKRIDKLRIADAGYGLEMRRDQIKQKNTEAKMALQDREFISKQQKRADDAARELQRIEQKKKQVEEDNKLAKIQLEESRKDRDLKIARDATSTEHANREYDFSVKKYNEDKKRREKEWMEERNRAKENLEMKKESLAQARELQERKFEFERDSQALQFQFEREKLNKKEQSERESRQHDADLQVYLNRSKQDATKYELKHTEDMERRNRINDKAKEDADAQSKNDQYNKLRLDLAGLFSWLNDFETDLNEDKSALFSLKGSFQGSKRQEQLLGVMFFSKKVSGFIHSARDKINNFARKDFTLAELIKSEGVYTFFASFVGQLYRSVRFNEFKSSSITLHYKDTRYNLSQNDVDTKGAVEFFSNVKRVSVVDENTGKVNSTVLVYQHPSSETSLKLWPWQKTQDRFG